MKHRIRRSAQQWKLLIQEQERSHLSQKAFCSENDLSYPSFTKWRQKLRETNNEFLPISTQAHELSTQSPSVSLAIGWGRFSLSVSF